MQACAGSGIVVKVDAGRSRYDREAELFREEILICAQQEASV